MKLFQHFISLEYSSQQFPPAVLPFDNQTGSITDSGTQRSLSRVSRDSWLMCADQILTEQPISQSEASPRNYGCSCLQYQAGHLLEAV